MKNNLMLTTFSGDWCGFCLFSRRSSKIYDFNVTTNLKNALTLSKKNFSFYLSFLKFQSSILQDNSFTDFLEIVSNTLYSKKPTKLFLFSFKRKYIVPRPSLPNVLYLSLLSTPLVNNSFKQNQVFSWSPEEQTWTLDFLKTSSLIIAHDTS